MLKYLIPALILASGLTAAPEKHVRVVLDVSQSMRGTRSAPANDPSGHALLSVALLHDLARYELGPDGSFKVLPFDIPVSAVSGCPGPVPRSASGSWIRCPPVVISVPRNSRSKLSVTVGSPGSSIT